MAWNKNLPADATKIRNAPTDIQANWAAIEEGLPSLLLGSVNCVNRDDPAVSYASDPTALAEAVILYSKDDSTGDPQLYALRQLASGPTNVIDQLTGNTITETTNGGTAGGTLIKIIFQMFGTSSVVLYCGKSIAFSGNATVTFPTSYATIFSAWETSNDGVVQKTGIGMSTAGLTLRTENSVTVNWCAIGKI